MARKPLKLKARKHEDLAPNQLDHLITGWTYSFIEGPDFKHEKGKFECPGPYPFRSEKERESLYWEHRDYLLSFVGKAEKESVEFSNPVLPWGKRPAGWWDFEAVPKYGPRKLLEGNPDWQRGGLSRGMWSAWAGGSPTFESQFQYLKRNNLLFENEEKLAKRKRRKK